MENKNILTRKVLFEKTHPLIQAMDEIYFYQTEHFNGDLSNCIFCVSSDVYDLYPQNNKKHRDLELREFVNMNKKNIMLVKRTDVFQSLFEQKETEFNYNITVNDILKIII